MQTSVYVPDWLMARLPKNQPRGFLSTLVQERLVELFPTPAAGATTPEREQIEERLIRFKAKAIREAL